MKTRNVFATLFVSVLAIFTVFVVSCGSSADNEEIGQQVGDVMASVDESGGSTGSLAAISPEHLRRTYLRHSPLDVSPAWYESLFASEAVATTCKASSTFGSCTSNVITRTFGECTVLTATFDGTVTLTFDDAAVNGTCQMTAQGHSVTRVPDFTVTGRRGATLTVSKSGTIGQRITKGATAGEFAFSNDGIRRVFTNASGSTVFDFTTATTEAITVTGTTRASRTLDGGSLRVTDNVSNSTCDFAPNDVTWDGTCNCAISGSWTGSCSDGNTVSLELNGCGTARLTKGDVAQDVTFDRCESL